MSVGATTGATRCRQQGTPGDVRGHLTILQVPVIVEFTGGCATDQEDSQAESRGFESRVPLPQKPLRNQGLSCFCGRLELTASTPGSRFGSRFVLSASATPAPRPRPAWPRPGPRRTAASSPPSSGPSATAARPGPPLRLMVVAPSVDRRGNVSETCRLMSPKVHYVNY